MSTEPPQGRVWIALGAIGGGLAVALGAFAAHGLRGRLGEHMLGVFEKGVDYLALHALAVLAAGLLLAVRPGARLAHWAAVAFVAGVVLFSGSLFALALTGVRWLGMVTPFGGTAFLIGWALLAAGAWRAPR